MRRWLVVLLVLVVTGCRSASPQPQATTTTLLPDLPTSTVPATSTTDASFRPPAVVDLPYVQRLLETIYHLDGEATRYVYAKKTVDAELNERLDAIFAGPALADAKQVLDRNVSQGFVRFANPPGNATVRAIEVLQANSDCMVIQAVLDYNPQYKEAGTPETRAIIQLRRAPVVAFNPTGWGVVAAGDPDPGTDLRVC